MGISSGQQVKPGKVRASTEAEKATAGHRDNLDRRDVTVSKPTARHEPTRAGGAGNSKPRSRGTSARSGSARATISPLRGVMAKRAFQRAEPGAPTPVGALSGAPASLACALACASERASPALNAAQPGDSEVAKPPLLEPANKPLAAR